MFLSLDAKKVGAIPQERVASGAKLLGGGLLLGSHRADISAAVDKEPRLLRGSERLLPGASVPLHESLFFSGEKAPDTAGAFIFKPAGQGTDWPQRASELGW
jgi:hypothetical protein